jgi:FkbM family methyltransferase
MIRPIFRDAAILMVEAQSALEPELARAARAIGRAEHRIALLGANAGEEHVFYEMGTGSSLLPENSNATRTVTKSVTTTLDLLAAEALPEARAIFLKLDIQGAELMVLAGGEKTLARCAAVQLEVALLPYNAGAPLLAEVVAFMAECGFAVTEVAGFSRPGPHLVQIDLVFAPDGSPLRPDFFTF